jgi:hypothetical protein
MNFTNWIIWFLSFFKKEDIPEKEMVSSTKVHGREEEVSEFVNENKVHDYPRIYKTVETLNPHCGLVFQQIPDTTDSVLEEVKFKSLLEKIHKYDILGESEYNYIQNLPREKKEYLINISSK